MEENHKKHSFLIGELFVGFLLWAFYIVQEEFANYGMYQLISYGVHEVASIIPLVCIVATILSVGYLSYCLIKRNCDRTGKMILMVLLLCLIAQMGYFYHQSKMVSTVAVCTVEEIRKAEETIVVSIGDEKKIELHSPMLVNGLLVEEDQQYLITYQWKKGQPNKGKLLMIERVE